MSARRSWIATTHTVVQVTTTSQVALPANEVARYRMLIPMGRATVWIGLDQPAVSFGGRPLNFLAPWLEIAAETADVMFRDAIHMVHDIEGAVVDVLVIEGEEAAVIP